MFKYLFLIVLLMTSIAQGKELLSKNTGDPGMIGNSHKKSLIYNSFLVYGEINNDILYLIFSNHGMYADELMLYPENIKISIKIEDNIHNLHPKVIGNNLFSAQYDLSSERNLEPTVITFEYEPKEQNRVTMKDSYGLKQLHAISRMMETSHLKIRLENAENARSGK